MAMADLTTDVKTPPPEWRFEGEGLGTLRSTGAMIVLLLSLEDEGSRAGILVDAAKTMGLSLEDLTDEYLYLACDKCGMSMVLHKMNSGQCP